MYPYNLFIEVLCFFLALLLLKNSKAGLWNYFKVYMLITVVMEAAGWLLRSYWHVNNQWVYNIFAPVQALFLYWMFYQIYPKKFNSRLFLGACMALFAAVYIYECFQHPFTVFNNYSWIVFSFTIIIACGLYYYFLLKDEAYMNLGVHPPFWFVTGLFIYFFSSSVCTLFFSELVRINVMENISLRYLLFILFNLILYGCWSYAFLCKYKQTRSLQ
jgi:hypothetical protein